MGVNHACSISNPRILSSCEALAKFRIVFFIKKIIIGCEESSFAAVPPVSDALLLTVIQKVNTTMDTAKVQR
jgi:hypothetical protein